MVTYFALEINLLAQEYQTLTDCLIFQNSFKLGARMMLEVTEE